MGVYHNEVIKSFRGSTRLERIEILKLVIVNIQHEARISDDRLDVLISNNIKLVKDSKTNTIVKAN